MRILYITHHFFPRGDASTSIIANIAKEFQRRGNQGQIIAITDRIEENQCKMWDNILVDNLYCPGIANKSDLISEWRTKPTWIAHAILQKNRKRIKEVFKRNEFIPLSMNALLVDIYRKGIRRHINIQDYDLCIITLAPREAVKAALEIQLPQKIPTVIYQLDAYWADKYLPDCYIEDRKKFERLMASQCLFVLTTRQIAKLNSEHSQALAKKWISLEFPLVTDLHTEKTKENDFIHCVFLGTLYKDLRPPEKVIRIISALQYSNLHFDFYGSGQELISCMPEYKENKEVIHLLGSISSEKVHYVRQQADILVNIDNTNPIWIPSKIFEYISTGKPIVNFYYNEESEVIKYLSNYKLHINIYLNGDIYKETKKLAEFLNSMKGKSIPYSEIKELYIENTPEYVVDKILEHVNMSL